MCGLQISRREHGLGLKRGTVALQAHQAEWERAAAHPAAPIRSIRTPFIRSTTVKMSRREPTPPQPVQDSACRRFRPRRAVEIRFADSASFVCVETS